MRETKSTCPYCGVGCGVIVQSEGEEITGVRGDPDHPANFGRLCTKGATHAEMMAANDGRLRSALVRPSRNDEPVPAPVDDDQQAGDEAPAAEQLRREIDELKQSSDRTARAADQSASPSCRPA